MTKLFEQISSKLPAGMTIPEPLNLLYAWIENRNQFVDNERGRFGFLHPDDRLKKSWTDVERPGGTLIEFYAGGNEDLHHWFGHEKSEVINRPCVFAQTGADGSKAAFWLDDKGKQKIVHLGSGSGSMLVCVLAESAIDFLRLLSIGYDEICWSDNFSSPPNKNRNEGEPYVHPNVDFQNWVTDTFSVSIPQNGLEIVKHPSEMGDEDSNDEFCRWVEENCG